MLRKIIVRLQINSSMWATWNKTSSCSNLFPLLQLIKHNNTTKKPKIFITNILNILYYILNMNQMFCHNVLI